MKDLLGNEVQVGDRVVISMTGYRDLMTAEVVKLTPKGVKAKYRAPRWPDASTYAYSETFRGIGMFVKVPA